MSTNWTYLIIASSILLVISPAYTDVAHFFAAPAEFGSYQLHEQVPFQLPPFQSNLYGPPFAGNPTTPAPVAPPTTEFSLPEIIENRSLKSLSQGHVNFIPLSQQYLPPAPEDRPNYESPKPRLVRKS